MMNIRMFGAALGMLAVFISGIGAQTQFNSEANRRDADNAPLITDGAAKTFSFKFKKGAQSRILSSVYEDVFFNGNFHHHADILNRITATVTDVDAAGTSTEQVHFMTSENSTVTRGAGNFTWGEEYRSVFSRTADGKYEIGDNYFMPTVRNVPVFPAEPLRAGAKWTAEGSEAHDLRRTFGIPHPYKVPFVASYEYKGDARQADGTVLCLIEVQYNLYFESPAAASGADKRHLPAVTAGQSNQKIWWDNERGAIDHYSESFRIFMQTFGGETVTFQGTARAEVTEYTRSATKENLSKITERVNELGLKDVQVAESTKGLTIIMEDIQFEADSADLSAGEKKKLDGIADILKNFSNDILVTGHCADRGTVASQQKLSEERAASVADYLSGLGVRKPDCIFTAGKGASEPAASNATEAGRKRNRRVEITLMDE